MTNTSNTSVNTTQAGNATSDYFDLTVRGVGYLQRARIVAGKGKKTAPMLCVSVNAIHGSKQDISYTYFDCIVRGTKAAELVTQHLEQINAISCNDGKTTHAHKVLANFSLGDPRTEKYMVSGEARFSLKARLLKISRLSIDGVVVYDSSLEAANEVQEPAVTLSTGTAG